MATGGDGGDTELVVDTHLDFPDSDRFVRITVRLVPVSEAYPEGVKYSMHYGDYDGRTILRYDNSHGDTKGHERHTPEGSEEIDFPGWRNLLQQFRQEVIDHERTHD
ncbi:MAG: DUF6516 family protein [Halobacteriales archaeon]